MKNKKTNIVVLCLAFVILVCSILFAVYSNSKYKEAQDLMVAAQNIEPEIVTIVEEKIEYVEVEPTYYYDVSSMDRELWTRLTWRESGNQSLECMIATASVIMNRVENGYWGDNLYDVVYSEGEFTPARFLGSTTPSEKAYEAVDYVIKNGPSVPSYVLYFNTSDFSWPTYRCYEVLGAVHFGYLTTDKG